MNLLENWEMNLDITIYIYQFYEFFISGQFYKSFVGSYYIKWLCYLLCNTNLKPMNYHVSRNESLFDLIIMTTNPTTYPTFTMRAKKEMKRERPSELRTARLKLPSNLYFFFLKGSKTMCKRLYSLYTPCWYPFWRKWWEVEVVRPLASLHPRSEPML